MPQGPGGALFFTRPMLSRKLQHFSEIEMRVNSNPKVSPSKRPRIITRPDVDCTPWLWSQHMEQEQEVVNSGDAYAKSAMFEEALNVNVPEDKRFPGAG